MTLQARAAFGPEHSAAYPDIWTVRLSSAGGELSGDGYQRVQVPNGELWAVQGEAVVNTEPIDLGTPEADWEPVVEVAWLDEFGTVVASSPVSPAVTPLEGIPLVIPAGGAVIV